MTPLDPTVPLADRLVALDPAPVDEVVVVAVEEVEVAVDEVAVDARRRAPSRGLPFSDDSSAMSAKGVAGLITFRAPMLKRTRVLRPFSELHGEKEAVLPGEG